MIEGTPEAVEALLAWARLGPPAAQVERVDVSAAEGAGSPASNSGLLNSLRKTPDAPSGIDHLHVFGPQPFSQRLHQGVVRSDAPVLAQAHFATGRAVVVAHAHHAGCLCGKA